MVIEKIGHEAVPIEWEGNPYVGLRSFRYDENAIFYGRRHTINLIEEKFTRSLHDKAPCLFVLGESGSGKSSLVRAGLLPDIIEFGWVENTQWKWFDIMPSQFRGNVYNGILSKLVEAFPVLNEKAIGKDLMMGKEVNFDHLSDILPDKTDESVLFFIDQFEEIFTDPLITEEERIRTFGLLRGMASTHKIWMIFSMRNDFYHRFTAYPVLSELKNDSILFDLPKIRYSEIQEILEEPAKKAGLKWETNEQGIPLNRTILQDISSGVDDLPLIEFALSELYNLRNEHNVLTYKAYEDIGKIDGAVVKYVDNFYNTLSEKEKELFYQILSALVAPSLENKNLYVRKTALLKDLQKTELHRNLLSNLINSHILISGKDENNEATVSIVHEILISSWKVIQDWIEQEKYFIDANNHYENLSKYWTKQNKTKDNLLQGAAVMKESEYFLYSWENNCSANVKDFLFASIKRKKRKFLPWVLFFLLGGCIAFIILCVQYLKNSPVVKELLEDLDVLAVSGGKTNIVLPNILTHIMMIVLLMYVAWKKIKAVPNYRTINVSLIIWSVILVLAIAIQFVSDVSMGHWIFIPFVLLKLILTVIQKRETLQWKKRIFKKDFNFLSVFMDNSSAVLQRVLKAFIWLTLILLISSLAIGGYFVFDIVKKRIKYEYAYNTVDELFNRLSNISSTLPASDRIYFDRKHLEYLKKNHEEELKSAGRQRFQYALIQYNLGHPESVLENVSVNFSSPNNLKLVIIAAFELGLFDDCRQFFDEYKKSLGNAQEQFLGELDKKVIWIAEKVGLFEMVKEILEASPNPSKGGESSDDSVLDIYKAHALLMTGESEKALSLYRKQVSNYKNEIEKDFAAFRWLGFSDTEISVIEKELHLNRINVYTHPDDDTNTALAIPFTGKWRYEENGTRIQWELKDNHHLCHYLFQTKEGDKWIDNDIAVTRYRFKQVDNKTIIEEYNARSNSVTVREIEKNNDEVKVTDNGKIKIYRNFNNVQ